MAGNECCSEYNPLDSQQEAASNIHPFRFWTDKNDTDDSKDSAASISHSISTFNSTMSNELTESIKFI